MSTNPNYEPSEQVNTSLAASVGEVGSPDGRTSVRVERSGRYVVVHEWVEERTEHTKQGEPEGGERREEAGGDVRELDIDPEEMFAAVDELPRHVDFPNRPGLPDEAIVTFTIESDAGSTVERMWLRDAEREAARLVAPLKAVVERATDGRRYL
jgi:hypothetical protein